MLTHQDIKQVRTIVKEETEDLRQAVERIENNVDKILKIVTDDRQELTLAKAKIDQHDARIKKLERKTGVTSPSSPSIAFA